MKKILTLGVLLLSSLFMFAQTDWTTSGIEQLLKEYMALIDNGDIAASIDYMHPSLFKLESKEMISQKLEESFNDPELQVKLSQFQVKKIGDIVTYKSINYSLVDYEMDITMKHIPEEGAEDKELEEMNGFMQAMYEAMYGEENVVFDEEDHSFVITSNNQMFAIGDPEIGAWKILENKEGMKKMLGNIVPKKVIKKMAKL